MVSSHFIFLEDFYLFIFYKFNIKDIFCKSYYKLGTLGDQ